MTNPAATLGLVSGSVLACIGGLLSLVPDSAFR